MEKENKELNEKLDNLVSEYNNLADMYNHLLADKQELERKNRQKAKELLYQQEKTR